MPDPLEDATVNMVFGYLTEQLALDGHSPSYVTDHRDLIIRCILGTLDALNIPIAEQTSDD